MLMDELMKVYVVFGTTGEYSDRCEWPVVGYLDEGLAKAHVLLATSRAKEWETSRKSDFSDAPKGWSEYDKELSMDYTGTEYFYKTVDIYLELPNEKGVEHV